MNLEIIENCELNGLPKYCGAQAGAVREIMVSRAVNVKSIPTKCTAKGSLEGEIEMNPEKGFYSYLFNPDQAIFTETPQKTANGVILKQRLEIFRHGHDQELLAELCRLHDQHHIIKMVFFNGLERLLGDLANPAIFLGGDTSGRQRTDRNGGNLSFVRDGLCPAPTLSDDFLVPSSVDPDNPFPLAALSVSRGGLCDPVTISAQGSLRRDSSSISTATPGAQVQLVYTFGPLGTPYYEASIGPDGSVTNINDWTFVRGSWTVTEFQNHIVNKIRIGGNPITFSYDPQLQASAITDSSLEVHLTIKEFSIPSRAKSGSFTLNDRVILGTGFTGSAITIRLTTLSQCGLLVNWGDGTQETAVGYGGGFPNAFIHNYAQSDDYEIEITASPQGLGTVEITHQNLTKVKPIEMEHLQFLNLTGNNIGTAFSLAPFQRVKNAYLASMSLTYIDPGPNADLVVLDLTANNVTNAIDLTPYPNLNTLFLNDNNVSEIKLGGEKANLNTLNLTNNNLPAAQLDSLVDELWEMRASGTTPTVHFIGNPGASGLSSTSLDKINGTGAYVGEGLEPDYGWDFIL